MKLKDIKLDEEVKDVKAEYRSKWHPHSTQRGIKVRVVTKAAQQAEREKEEAKERREQEREFGRTPEGRAQKAVGNIAKLRLKPIPHLDNKQVERIMKRDVGVEGTINQELHAPKPTTIEISSSASKYHKKDGGTPEMMKVAAVEANYDFVFDDEKGQTGERDAQKIVLFRDPVKPNIIRARRSK
jgi:hypothetical protein